MSLLLSLDEIVERDPDPLLHVHPSWERVRLGEVAKVVNGFPFKSSLFNASTGRPVVRIRNVMTGETDTRTTEAADVMYSVHPGDLLVGMDGDFNSARWTGPEALLNQRVCKVELLTDLYESRLLDLAMPGYLAAINRHTSSVTVKHLSSRSIEDIPLPLPPLAEQRRIVAKLDELLADVDVGVEALQAAKRDLARYRTSVLKAAVEGDLTAAWRAAHGPAAEPADALLARILTERRARWEADQQARYAAKGQTPPKGWQSRYPEPAAPDASDLPDLPDGWTWASVEQIGFVITGSTPSTSRPEFYGGEHPFYKPSDLDAGFDTRAATDTLTDAGLAEARLVPKMSVLVTCIGATIGKAGLIRTLGACNQQINAVVPVEPMHSMLLYFIIVGPDFQQQIKDNASATTLPILNKSKFSILPVPLPPIAEQAEIVAAVERRLSIADTVEKEVDAALARAAQLRQRLLRHAFEGRLVPQDPADEPASELLARIQAEKAKAPSGARRGRRPKAESQAELPL